MKKRIIALLLSALCICSFGVACNKKGEDGPAGDVGEQPREKYRYTDGVHNLTAPETEDYIVRNGQCDYKILLPKNADANLNIAAEELKFFFAEATGVRKNNVTPSMIQKNIRMIICFFPNKTKPLRFLLQN